MHTTQHIEGRSIKFTRYHMFEGHIDVWVPNWVTDAPVYYRLCEQVGEHNKWIPADQMSPHIMKYIEMFSEDHTAWQIWRIQYENFEIYKEARNGR